MPWEDVPDAYFLETEAERNSVTEPKLSRKEGGFSQSTRWLPAVPPQTQEQDGGRSSLISITLMPSPACRPPWKEFGLQALDLAGVLYG